MIHTRRPSTKGLVEGFVEAMENAAARLICRSVTSPDETLDLLGTDERRALALERVVLGRFGRAIGKRRALLFAGGHRPTGTRGMVRFEVAERKGRAPDEAPGGAPTRIVLSAIVVNKRAQGELLLWRTSEHLVSPWVASFGAGWPGRPLRFADHASVEGALVSYAPDFAYRPA